VLAGFILGARVLPVLSLALPFYYLFATAGAMIGVGGAQVCAHLIGWQRNAECQRAFSLVYVLAVLFGVLLAVVLILLIDPTLALMGAAPDLLGPARDYLTVLCCGGVFIIGIYPAFNLLRLDGQTTKAALLFVVMGLLTITLDLLFLVGFGWGIASVAIAICLSYGFVSVTGALLLIRRSLNFRFVSPVGGVVSGGKVAEVSDVAGEAPVASVGDKEDIEADGGRGGVASGGVSDALRLVRDILTTGSPNALENLCIVARTAVINNVAGVAFGAVALGAYVVIDSATTAALVFIAGISGAAMAFLGVFFAEKDSHNTVQVLRLSFIWGIPTILAFTLLLELFAPDIALTFGARTGEELAVFSVAIRVFAAGLPFLLFNYVMITVYQSQRRMGASNAIVLVRELAAPLILMGLLTVPLGMAGIWAAFPAAELLTTAMVLLYGLMCRRNNRQLSPVFLVDRQAERDGKSVSLTVRNDPASIMAAVASIEEFCERRGLGARLAMGIQLSLEEMMVAISEHSFAGHSGRTMNVRVLVLGDEVIIRIRNGGARFNPVHYAKDRIGTFMQSGAADEGVAAVAVSAPGANTGVPGADVSSAVAGMDKGATSASEAVLEVTGIMMVLKMAEVVDYRSTFGTNNLMMILRG
jgi:Na+-driven multidrug efflux pump